MTDQPYDDPRFRNPGHLAKPWRSPSGLVKKSGSLVVPINQFRASGGVIVTHQDFHAVAVALDLTMSAGEEARQYRADLVYHDRRIGARIDRHVNFESNDALLAYFKQSMVVVTFGIQTLEMFANWAIGTEVTTCYPWPGKRKAQPTRLLASTALQREVSLESKLRVILPDLLHCSVPSEKSALWISYIEIAKLRNDVIHAKAHHQQRERRAGSTLDNTTIWRALYKADVPSMPKTVVRLLRHYTHGAETPAWISRPPWLEAPLAQYGLT